MNKQAYDDGLASGLADDPSQYQHYDVGGLSYYSWLAGFFDGRSEINEKAGRPHVAAKRAMAAEYYKDTAKSLKQEAAQ